MAITIANYSYRQLITGTSPASSLGGFVALVNQASVDASFFTNADNGGGDIRVSTDSAGANQLPCEVVTCNTGTSELVLWVRFPTYATGSRELYIFAGNTGQAQPAVTDTYGRNNVWQDKIAGSHFQNTPDSATGNDFLDFKSATTGSSVGTPTLVDGENDGDGWQFVDGTSYAQGDFLNVSTASDFTVSALVKFNAITSSDAVVWNFNNTAESERLYLGVDDSASKSWKLFSQGETPGDGNSATIGVWYHTHVTYNSTSNLLSLYVNGSLDYSVTPTGAKWKDNAGGFFVGDASGVKGLDGIVAEISTAQARLSADHIASEYDNQSAPSTFWTQSTPDDPSGGGISSSISETAQAFTSSSNATVTGNITLSLVESAQPFTSAISAINTGNISASLVEQAQAFTSALIASVSSVTTINITASESAQIFTASISTTATGNISASASEQAQEFISSATVERFTLNNATIAETAQVFVSGVALRTPTTWTDKQSQATNWTDKASVTASWTNKASAASAWIDK